MAEHHLEISKLELSNNDYRKFVNSPVLNSYNQLDYANSKPLEYLTTMTLLALQPGDKILDAAGGEDAEYIKALMAVADVKFTA
ncbi:MAG: hypothetical protein PHO08_11165 [Methylococcales bacterium]|nr:hypothetical protein [Methylococcales bacterium]